MNFDEQTSRNQKLSTLLMMLFLSYFHCLVPAFTFNFVHKKQENQLLEKQNEFACGIGDSGV